MPTSQHQAIAEALDDLDAHSTLHPSTAQPQSLARRRAQWDHIRGGRSVGTRWLALAPVALFGAFAGWLGVVALKGDAPMLAQYPVEWAGALAGLIFFFLVGRTVTRSAGFDHGMVLVIANERESVIQREKVTGQVRVWVPKALLAWRYADWLRDGDDKPYLWLHLPFGERIEDTIRTTLDVLTLPKDEFTARDAAVYTQRTVNRTLSDSALDHAAADEGEDKNKGGLSEWVPYGIAAALPIFGLLIVVLTG